MIAAGVAAAIGAGYVPDPKLRAAMRWGGIALAAVAAWRLIRGKGSLAAGIAGELGIGPSKPGEIVSGSPLGVPAAAVSSTYPEEAAPPPLVTPASPVVTPAAPGELIVTPPKPTHAFARIVEPAPGGDAPKDFWGDTYSVVLEVTNPTAAAVGESAIVIETHEHDSGFFDWDTADKAKISRTYLTVPALDSGGAWRGEIKVKYSGESFYLSRSIFARVLVNGHPSSSTYFWLTRWLEGVF